LGKNFRSVKVLGEGRVKDKCRTVDTVVERVDC
jgi:hypothetical protein